MNNPWQALYQNLDRWGLYQDSPTLHLFLHLQVRAASEVVEWQHSRTVNGKFVTTIVDLHEETGIEIETIERCFDLLNGRVLDYQRRGDDIIIRIKNYGVYQMRPTSGQRHEHTRRHAAAFEQACRETWAAAEAAMRHET